MRTNALIFNGQDTGHGQWPWHAAIYQQKGYDMVYNCGGSFAGTKTIITGKSCYHFCAPYLKQFDGTFQMEKQLIELQVCVSHNYAGVISKIFQ